MAGNPYTALDLNNRAGALVSGLWTSLEEVRKFKLWLDDAAHDNTALVAVGMTTPDLTVIRNSFADLGGASGLYAVAHGTFDPSGVNNYFFNAKQLTGLNYAG